MGETWPLCTRLSRTPLTPAMLTSLENMAHEYVFLHQHLLGSYGPDSLDTISAREMEFEPKVTKQASPEGVHCPRDSPGHPAQPGVCVGRNEGGEPERRQQGMAGVGDHQNLSRDKLMFCCLPGPVIQPGIHRDDTTALSFLSFPPSPHILPQSPQDMVFP